MNLVKGEKPVPLRVLMVNPLAPASEMVIMKILIGFVFGKGELIDLTLLVYVNEIEAAEALKLALNACAYSESNSIIVTSQLPNTTDADVFCFITSFENPNFVDFDNCDKDATFDTFYLLLQLAHNFSLQPLLVEKQLEDDSIVSVKKRMKPIFMTDGLVSIDILSSFSKNIPADVLFCPTSLAVIAKSVLAEYLKVNCNVLNDILVWAANDSIFHVEIQKPCITYDTLETSGSRCTWDTMSKDVMDSLSLEHTHFNASWLKKEYIEMIRNEASHHPYGSIYKASEFGKALRDIWNFRTDANITNSDNKKTFDNFGVISDGSLGSMKGYPYVLPVMFKGDEWKVDKRFAESSFLKSEMKRINKAVKQNHTKLMKYCQKFLDENVIHRAFVQKEDESSTYSMDMTTTSPPPSLDTIADKPSFGNSISPIHGPRPATRRACFNVSRSSDTLN